MRGASILIVRSGFAKRFEMWKGRRVMDEAGLIARLVGAAEEWGLQRFGKPMKALRSTGLEEHTDGSTTITVDLYEAQQTPESGTQPTRVTCITTLEPDGQISCYSPRDGQ